MRLLGIDIEDRKAIRISLLKIYGLGPTRVNKMLAELKIDGDRLTKEITEEESSSIRNFIVENYKIEGDLRRDTRLNIKRLMEIGCYRGIRHRKGLPVRGQSTKQNARTRKGPRKTVTNKKKVSK